MQQPERRVNLLMRTPVSRVGLDCVKIIVAFSKNPIVEELKKFNRNIRPVKSKRKWSEKTFTYVWVTHLTSTDFIAGWRYNVFRELNDSIMRRVKKTVIYSGLARTIAVCETNRHHWHPSMYTRPRGREISQLANIKSKYRWEKEQKRIKSVKQNRTVWDIIPYNETVFGFVYEPLRRCTPT